MVTARTAAEAPRVFKDPAAFLFSAVVEGLEPPGVVGEPAPLVGGAGAPVAAVEEAKGVVTGGSIPLMVKGEEYDWRGSVSTWMA